MRFRSIAAIQSLRKQPPSRVCLLLLHEDGVAVDKAAFHDDFVREKNTPRGLVAAITSTGLLAWS
eukprot:scaffold427448_cov15-Prasinocladus_malaysianus.AAC.1